MKKSKSLELSKNIFEGFVQFEESVDERTFTAGGGCIIFQFFFFLFFLLHRMHQVQALISPLSTQTVLCLYITNWIGIGFARILPILHLTPWLTSSIWHPHTLSTLKSESIMSQNDIVKTPFYRVLGLSSGATPKPQEARVVQSTITNDPLNTLRVLSSSSTLFEVQPGQYCRGRSD